ncbi:chitinase [Actinotalea sp. K2]|uniref:chitinase n=1 Tax=Actinotalea sp. K2 TaxID=2939438 RepID=UPI0020175DAD|nr:carbohydrate-binding protein [Actinotalea sp. K2]MCL3861024.1 glycosyl hydrolase family 18 [Actinotalea sp. K2]
MTTALDAPRPPRMRISLLRVGVVLLCASAVVWGGYRSVSEAVTQAVVPEQATFAAYVDVTAWPPYPFETPEGPAQASVILSFVVADTQDRCTPSWGGYYTLDEAASEIELDRRVSQLRLTGGDARVSFGGALNDELATVCTDLDDLREAYGAVVDRYELTSIDLDIEGPALDDTAANERRAQAVRALQDDALEQGSSLAVWLTLPVAPTGLTDQGVAVLAGMLAAGVDVAGVNGMTMDFNVVTTPDDPLADVVLQASTALQAQVQDAYTRTGQPLDDADAWAKVGITPMIGQSDIAAERFTLADAEVVNEFARAQGVGQVSMWSLNRDSTCSHPLPKVLTVVQTGCSGIDQGAGRFAEVLAADLASAQRITAPSPTPSEDPTPVPDRTAVVVDDPETSPFPIWDPLGTYPAGTKIVWRQQVFEAWYWTSGFAPDTPVSNAKDSPWTLIGPVMPGDTPAPLPTLPAGSYPEWDPEEVYQAGTRVLLDQVPYEAKWWSQGQEPGVAIAGGSPWVLVMTGG